MAFAAAPGAPGIAATPTCRCARRDADTLLLPSFRMAAYAADIDITRGARPQFLGHGAMGRCCH